MHVSALLVSTVLSSSAAVFVAQEPAGSGVACDRAAIAWVLPGDFPRALELARSGRRILVVKGISFGVDEAGAKCATKGFW
jgi:hypothetical protein